MPEFYLDFLGGDRAGSALHFEQEVVRVGRNDEAELPFDEMGVSWEHAEFRYRDGNYWVIDSGSTNGTYVNDERAHNARLKDGDVIRFGKKGTKLRFRLKTDAAVVIPQSSSEHPGYLAAKKAAGEEISDEEKKDLKKRKRTRLPSEPDLPALSPADLGEEPAPRSRRRSGRAAAPAPAPAPAPAAPSPLAAIPAAGAAPALASPPALMNLQAVSANPNEGYSDLPPAASVMDGGSRLNGVLLVVPSVLFCAALVLLGLVYVDSLDLQDLLREERRAADDLREELREVKEQARQIEDEALSDERRKVERLERELTRVKRREDERVSRERDRGDRLERESASLRRDNTRLREALADERENNRNYENTAASGASGGRANWKAIEKRLSPSVVFIATRVYGKDRNGKRVDLSCFGTGFFASDDGHIVTNKHVIQPWKFGPLAKRMVKEDISIMEDTYEVHCWRGGARFLRRRRGRHLEFNLASGFSTRTDTLKIVRTAPDVWEDNMAGGGDVRAYRIHAAGNEDLAILQATDAKAAPIPLARSEDVGKLDEVMVLGFPAGVSILERGTAETSPAMGTVRKVEDTIQISAAMIGGNSGGPLIDARGRVIGISTRVVTGTETLGTCLRIEHAKELLHGGRW